MNLVRETKLYRTDVVINAWERKQVTVELQTPNVPDKFEAEEMAMKEMEERFPELEDAVVSEVNYIH